MHSRQEPLLEDVGRELHPFRRHLKAGRDGTDAFALGALVIPSRFWLTVSSGRSTAIWYSFYT